MTILNDLFLPCLITTYAVIENSFRKEENKKPYRYYTYTFFAMLAIKMAFSSMGAEAVETIAGDTEDFIEFRIDDSSYYLHSYKMTQRQKDEALDKALHHRKIGQQKFFQAGKICYLLPQKSDQEIADRLFHSAMSVSIGATNGWAGVAIALLYELGNEIHNSSKEYCEMRDLLNESKMHFDLMEFHYNIYKNG